MMWFWLLYFVERLQVHWLGVSVDLLVFQASMAETGCYASWRSDGEVYWDCHSALPNLVGRWRGTKPFPPSLFSFYCLWTTHVIFICSHTRKPEVQVRMRQSPTQVEPWGQFLAHWFIKRNPKMSCKVLLFYSYVFFTYLLRSILLSVYIRLWFSHQRFFEKLNGYVT